MSNKLPRDLSRQLTYAMYLPAISPGYGEMAVQQASQTRQMPAGLTPKDLNFLDPNSKLFYLPAALYSAGIVSNLSNPPKSMITTRDKKLSHILADSGGYQIISGKLSADSLWDRKQIYDWQRNNTDFGMTLDAPTAAIANPNSSYTTFQECLNDTLDHLRDYQTLYERNEFPLLNVLQGRDGAEADSWYNEVKAFSLNGWAFAGPLKEDLYEVIRRVLALIEQDRLNEKECWIHFLGLGKFKFAALLTILRDSIRKKLGDTDFHISMDTSSPGLAAMKYRNLYTTTNFTAKNFSLNTGTITPNNPKHLGSSAPFPYPYSPIGKLLTMGDLIVKKGAHKNSRMDMLSACMLANHNYYVYCRAIMLANDELAKHPGLTTDTVPIFIQDAKRAIEDIFDAPNPTAELDKHMKILKRV